jgi:hypothetical protein
MGKQWRQISDEMACGLHGARIMHLALSQHGELSGLPLHVWAQADIVIVVF